MFARINDKKCINVCTTLIFFDRENMLCDDVCTNFIPTGTFSVD
jgi:hypothetical protein